MALRAIILAIFISMISANSGSASAMQSIGHTTSAPARTVVLVHGFKDTSRKMQFMADYLRREGWTVYTPTLTPSWGQIGLDALAGQLATFIDTTLKPGEKFDLVGFSMGGLVCRYYLQRLDGAHVISRLVTVGAPNRGSLWAWVVPNAGCRQMRPGSQFLADLNGDAVTFQKVRFISIWTPFDLMILPSNSSEMPQARNEKLNIALHPLLVFDKRSLSAVAVALRE